MSEKEKKSADPGVLYLDADTEITEAIEKLKKSSEDEVRIVVPSRSGLLQSQVNVKLLKKAAKDSKKDLVLVTNDRITKNLAGAAGIAVASSVKAMPHVPDVEKLKSEPIENIRLEAEEDTEKSESKSEKSTSKPKKEGFEPKHISLDGESEEESIADEVPQKKRKDKKVPDYGKLNKRIWIAGGAIAVVVILIIGSIFLPTAKVNLLTKAKKTSLNFNFILDSAATQSDIAAQTLAAQKLEATKDVTFQVTATGRKEIGNKATGSVSVRNCDDVASHSLPAGTGLSGGGKSFVTAQTVTIPAGSAGGGVVNCLSAVDVQITATAPGDTYNVGPTTFSINGFSSLYKASGQTSGGTSKTVTVLSAEDVASARKQAEQEAESGKDDLKKKAGNDQQLFSQTIQSDFDDFNTSVKQDNEADKVTVTAKVKFTGFAAKKDDVNKLFDDQVKEEIKGNKEIYQNGSQDGAYTVVKQFSAEKVQLNAKASAFYGDPIDKKEIAKSVAGKPVKEVSGIVKQKGDQITGAEVETWPGMIPNMPILSGRITIEIKVTTD
jgi:hypothetical protein